MEWAYNPRELIIGLEKMLQNKLFKYIKLCSADQNTLFLHQSVFNYLSKNI